MSRPIYVYGSPVLRQVAKDITPDYPGLAELIPEMHVLMREADGVGLAAPQIGLSIRLFVIDASPFKESYPEAWEGTKTFINAHILERFGDTASFQEGCLSVPGIHENVTRPTAIRMRYVDEHFVEHEEVFGGINARIIQHEYDHLDGKLFVDHLGPLRKRMIQKKLKDMARGRYTADYASKIG